MSAMQPQPLNCQICALSGIEEGSRMSAASNVLVPKHAVPEQYLLGHIGFEL